MIASTSLSSRTGLLEALRFNIFTYLQKNRRKFSCQESNIETFVQLEQVWRWQSWRWVNPCVKTPLGRNGKRCEAQASPHPLPTDAACRSCTNSLGQLSCSEIKSRSRRSSGCIITSGCGPRHKRKKSKQSQKHGVNPFFWLFPPPGFPPCFTGAEVIREARSLQTAYLKTQKPKYTPDGCSPSPTEASASVTFGFIFNK